MIKFLLLFSIYTLLFFSLLEINFFVELFALEDIATSFTVELTKYSIDIIGIDAKIDGAAFRFDNAIMMIDPDCNGLKIIMLFIAVILAYPSSIKVKIVWILSGIILLQLGNIIRITFLAYILRYHFEYFNFMHDYLTPAIIIATTLFLFYKYVNIANKSLSNIHNSSL